MYDAELLSDFSVDMFDPEYWQQRDAVLGSSTGRGTAWFVKHQNVNMVLRHYYRGGLIGKLVNDSYVFAGLMNTRAAREFVLLKTLQTLHLPAPKPLAIKVQQQGLTYRADILIELIRDAQDLVAILSKQALDHDTWLSIGQCIKRFHQQRIYHHDLNAHNIMLDNNAKVWLIDFDQGKQMPEQGAWQQQNLDRLHRSFVKERSQLTNFNFTEQNWQSLVQGYQQG
ncbi:3-deoxy-D-manno-octulosonic acid kinase [Thalassotalea ponticola]|uniref:3-deoxy-D-manno-octulosonic acid kinase n=1 Tax=Thalassotalea ponticola TaxID=1523392 RepID=UPI003528006F